MSLLPLYISLRFSRVHCRSSILSLVSLISTAGIALGVAGLLIGLSIMHGFEHELNNRILAVIPHGEIESINTPWENWSKAFHKITQIKGIVSASPYINFKGLIQNKNNFRVIQVKGVDPQQEKKISILPQFIKQNAWKNFISGKKQIIIGKGIADTLKINQGDWISIMFSNKMNFDNKLNKFKRIRLQVIGTIQLNGQFDYNLAVVPLKDAQHYLGMKNSITGIAIKVNNVFNATKLIRTAGETINNHAYIKSWISSYKYMYHDIQIVRIIVYFSMILVICLACVNIVSTLMLSIKERSNDVAVLYTIGAKYNFVRTVFIFYGLLIGIRGNLYGIVSGIIISLKLTTILHSIEKLTGYQLFSSTIYFINFLPSELHWLDVVIIFIQVLLLSFLISWYSLIHVKRIDPITLLRN